MCHLWSHLHACNLAPHQIHHVTHTCSEAPPPGGAHIVYQASQPAPHKLHPPYSSKSPWVRDTYTHSNHTLGVTPCTPPWGARVRAGYILPRASTSHHDLFRGHKYSLWQSQPHGTVSSLDSVSTELRAHGGVRKQFNFTEGRNQSPMTEPLGAPTVVPCMQSGPAR